MVSSRVPFERELRRRNYGGNPTFSAPASKCTVFTVVHKHRRGSLLGDIVISLGSRCFSQPVRAMETGARTDLMEVPLPRNPAIVQRKAGNIHQRNFFRDESSEVTTTGRAEETKYKDYMTMESSENVIADISSRSRASRSSWRWTAFACNSATSFSSLDYDARCQRLEVGKSGVPNVQLG